MADDPPIAARPAKTALLARSYYFILLPLVFFSITAITFGQNTVTGGFHGDVRELGTLIPVRGATVRITSIATGAVDILVTDSKGIFFKGGLAPGDYDLAISAPGFAAQLLRRTISITETNNIVPVPVVLQPEAVPTAPPTVAQDADTIRILINTTDARQADSAKRDEIDPIPLGSSGVTRSFDELAALTPGVAPPPQTIGDVAGPGVGPGVGSAGQFAVNGLRSRANNFTVDGSDNNDEDIGVRRQGFLAYIPQPIESVEEFSIITLLAPAQFGRNIGAQVNAVSRTGGTRTRGSLYGNFNSSQLNARNVFDTDNGTGTTQLRTLSGQSVLLDNTPITVRNQSGSEDSFTFAQGGATLGGSFDPRTFYFFSGEYQRINASREKNFAVPTVEQRGPFGTGATGLATNPFNGGAFTTPLFPTGTRSSALFSLFPFANNPEGIFGANTFTQSLPAGGRGGILSGRVDRNFVIGERKQTFTGRYNFTDDKRNIPAVNEAIFAAVLAKTRTHNLSLFLNSDLNKPNSAGTLFNQVRFSFGHTRLTFDEVRDTEFLIPSDELPNEPFLLNARSIFNVTLPQFGGQARYSRSVPGTTISPTTETCPASVSGSCIGPVGQVIIGGFSPLGADVYNFPQDRTNRTLQFADELSWRLEKHTLVFGADIRMTGLDSDLPRLSRTLLTFNGSPRLVPAPAGTACPNGGVQDSMRLFCFLAPGDPRSVISAVDLAGLGAASNSLLTFSVDQPDARADIRYNQFNLYGQDTWRFSERLSLSFGLRYEYNTPIREADRRIESTFSDPRLAAVPVLQRIINGRESLYQADRNNFAPRVGLAYSADLFGAGRVSVFRAGYGLFYDQILGAVANQSRNVFPTFLTLNNAGLSNFAEQVLTVSNPATITTANVLIRRPGTLNSFNTAGFTARGFSFVDVVSDLTLVTPNAINVTLPSEVLDTPSAHHYSFSFEQQLNRNFTVSAAYVGTTGRNLLRFTTPNLGSNLTTGPTNITAGTGSNVPRTLGFLYTLPRPLDTRDSFGDLQSLGAVNQFETTAPSQYHALQTQLRARFLNRFNFQLGYTFSRVTDEVSDVFDLAGAFVLPQNSFDLDAEIGPANFDVPHRIVYDLNYLFSTKDGGLGRKLLNGLQLSTTGRYRSGQPFTVNSVIDVNIDGNTTDRLNTLQGLEITGDRSQPLRLTTANTTSLLARFGQNGQIGRNSFRAGNVLEMDLSVIKKFTFNTQTLAIRTDIFNFIDRANYGIPVRLLEAPGFGRATNTVTPGRRVQFSVKYEF